MIINPGKLMNRPKKPSSGPTTILPLAGPFVGFTPVDYTSLPDLTVNSTLDVPNHTAAAPLMYNHLTINAIFRANLTANNKCVIVWVNILTLGAGASINANGRAGANGGLGGNGPRGASGPGGGAASDGSIVSGAFIPGGAAGVGTDGLPGTAFGFSTAGLGGVGTANTYRGSFGWPMGGNGGPDSLGIMSGGLAGPGFGGAGPGGPVLQDEAAVGASGASAPGLVAFIANQTIATAGSRMNATGAAGEFDSGGNYSSGPSGGGSVYFASMSYSGLISFQLVTGAAGASNGNAAAFQINPNFSTTSKLFTQNW